MPDNFPRQSFISDAIDNWLTSRRRKQDRRRATKLTERPSWYANIEVLEERLVLDVSAPAILQIFESTYDNIEDRSADIFAAGYGGVWVPPTGRADSGNQSVGATRSDDRQAGLFPVLEPSAHADLPYVEDQKLMLLDREFENAVNWLSVLTLQ